MAVGLLLGIVAACGSDPTETPPTPTLPPASDAREYTASTGAITIDGSPDDWSALPTFPLTLTSLDGRRQLEADFQVAVDDDELFMLVRVFDDYNATLGEHHVSGSFAVLWAIDEAAGPHMGTDGIDYGTSLGMVDIWHWEIDCGPGVLSGGFNRTEDGNDPACNLDDEYALTPFEREDDDGDNLLTGAYDHQARAQGEDAAGAWYWELKRPLVTGDAQDAQFAHGETAQMALAYWDPDETDTGWTDAGYLQSSDLGWKSDAASAVTDGSERRERV